ncbi:SusD/RagB family nutrient-binding outer membrane lipoprotein [Flavobacterium longum]|uniref:SusD/RagB family nutrient-binding outer membrane lipoprotein n=1 Tax=Flavobacterium longum TaxID=1299340 RepID=UPI0039EB8D57
MKKIFLILTCAAVIASCSDDYFDINRDPDNLAADGVAFSTELPAGIAGIAGSQGAYYALIGGFWSQMWTQSNASNQYKEIDDYSIGTLDYNGGWTTMYDALSDIRNIKRRAEAEGNWNYFLITTVLETHASQIMADFYGDIPYSQANNTNFLQPNFDSGEEVYDQMVEALQLALSKDLSTSTGEVPGNDDFIFGGNMDNWTAYANTLLLKVYMRQTEARPSTAQSGITALLNSGVDFLNTDAAMTQFEDAPDRSNPLYETDRRQLNTTTNIRASRTMFSYLDENNDPRRLEYYRAGNPLNQGDFNNTVGQTTISVVELSPLTPVYFMSREESLFLQAEAYARYAGGAGAKEAYDAGVQENFDKWGLNGAPFVAAGGAYEYPSAGSLADQIKAIITQKWASSFPGNGHEAFFEQNRTGYPEISPVPQTDPGYVAGEFAYSVNGTTGGEFPKRLVFPENVKSTNQNAPALIELTVPVWWDAN